MDIFCKTSTTSDGNMSVRFGDENEVVGNQKRWLETLGADHSQLCLMRCDHGDKISTIYRTNFVTGMRPEAEALMTNEPEMVLGLLTADCIPAIFYDPVREAIGLAHLNRKTIAHDLAIKTLAAMTDEFDTRAADVHIYFEPHIKTTSYHFPLPFNEPTPAQLEPFITEQNGIAYVDFAAAHRAQLLATGVPAENIHIADTDVGINTNYFSHYGNKRDSERISGRHLTVVQLRA